MIILVHGNIVNFLFLALSLWSKEWLLSDISSIISYFIHHQRHNLLEDGSYPLNLFTSLGSRKFQSLMAHSIASSVQLIRGSLALPASLGIPNLSFV